MIEDDEVQIVDTTAAAASAATAAPPVAATAAASVNPFTLLKRIAVGDRVENDKKAKKKATEREKATARWDDTIKFKPYVDTSEE